MSAAAVESIELREYEMLYILRSSTNGEEAESVMGRITDVMERLKGTLVRVDNWGRRKLAYPIAKSSRGVFVLIGFVSPADLIIELERTLGLLDLVVRVQVIVLKRGVSLADYKVEEEEVAFAPLEDEPESEEPTLAARLGLVDRPKRDYGDRDGGDRHAPSASGGDSGSAPTPEGDAKPAEAKPADGAEAKSADGAEAKPADGAEAKPAEAAAAKPADAAEAKPAEAAAAKPADAAEAKPAEASKASGEEDAS